jgi:hypothetical protein
MSGLLCFSTAGMADKADFIILENGDRIIGEVNSLISGQLELKAARSFANFCPINACTVEMETRIMVG